MNKYLLTYASRSGLVEGYYLDFIMNLKAIATCLLRMLHVSLDFFEALSTD
jgi:hypothetical protein